MEEVVFTQRNTVSQQQDVSPQLIFHSLWMSITQEGLIVDECHTGGIDKREMRHPEATLLHAVYQMLKSHQTNFAGFGKILKMQ